MKSTPLVFRFRFRSAHFSVRAGSTRVYGGEDRHVASPVGPVSERADSSMYESFDTTGFSLDFVTEDETIEIDYCSP